MTIASAPAKSAAGASIVIVAVSNPAAARENSNPLPPFANIRCPIYRTVTLLPMQFSSNWGDSRIHRSRINEAGTAVRSTLTLKGYLEVYAGVSATASAFGNTFPISVSMYVNHLPPEGDDDK